MIGVELVESEANNEIVLPQRQRTKREERGRALLFQNLHANCSAEISVIIRRDNDKEQILTQSVSAGAKRIIVPLPRANQIQSLNVKATDKCVQLGNATVREMPTWTNIKAAVMKRD
jgi:hypothetical protein